MFGLAALVLLLVGALATCGLILIGLLRLGLAVALLPFKLLAALGGVLCAIAAPVLVLLLLVVAPVLLAVGLLAAPLLLLGVVAYFLARSAAH